MLLRELEPGDWPEVIELNQASVRELSDVDDSRLAYLSSCAHRAVVIETDGVLTAFALAMGPRAGYDSRNYQWFESRFERFLYLDRIAVAERHRRAGFATRIYDELESTAAGFGRMVCDVNVEPPNDASLAFHARRGYLEIGRLQHADKLVALMSKELGS